MIWVGSSKARRVGEPSFIASHRYDRVAAKLWSLVPFAVHARVAADSTDHSIGRKSATDGMQVVGQWGFRSGDKSPRGRAHATNSFLIM
jgi:hypothetical protein